MSFDLYQRETNERLSAMPGVTAPPVGAWDGFARGVGLTTMRNLARTGRAIDLIGSVGPIAQDAITGGTEAQDKYFREHDEVWGRAVEYWTPKPNEVGIAGQIVGELASLLPMVMASPSLAVASYQLATAEELVQKGVDPGRAGVVGAAQAAGLGLGIWMPIFGQNLWQRVVLGGAGFNVLQGAGMRAAGEILLQGTPAADQFKTFDWNSITLDVLAGAMFGGIVHLSPQGRAQGAEMWKRMEAWGVTAKPTQKAAALVLRQAEHLNVDSTPGKPTTPVAVEEHVNRVRTALEQMERDQRVDVSHLPEPRMEPDPARTQEMEANLGTLRAAGKEVAKLENLAPRPSQIAVPEMPGLTPEMRAIETKSRRMVAEDLEGLIAKYHKIPDTDNGKVLNVDVARELFPDYAASPITRSRFSAAVHEPASAVVKEIYARKLQEPDPLGLNMVTFTAGGTGAGKSSALGAVPLVSKVVQASQIVYDTNMAGTKSAIAKIDQALAAGKQPRIVYVAADPVQGFDRMLSRAMKKGIGVGEGRAVPLEDHARTYTGSVDTVEALMTHYSGDDRVQFIFLDNTSGPKGDVSIVEPQDAVRFLRAMDFENLEPRLKEVLDAQYKAGRINEEVYRGVAHTYAEGAGAADRAGDGGKPRAGEEGAAPAERGPVIVYRLGYSGEDSAAGKWVGTPARVEAHLAQYDDLLMQTGDTLYAFEVNPADTRLGKVNKLFPKLGPTDEQLSPEARTKLVAKVPLDSIRGEVTAEKIEAALTKARKASEGPAAKRGVAEPPPRGKRGAKAAGLEDTQDPVTARADAIVADRPDMPVRVGTESDGAPIMTTARQYLEDARDSARAAAEDSKLFEVASRCLLGRA